MDVSAAKEALRDTDGGASRECAEKRALKLGVEAVAMPLPLALASFRGERDKVLVAVVVVEDMAK